MSQCLSCQEETGTPDRVHAKCLKKLFGVSWVPKIAFGIADMPAEISKAGAHMSISGVQIKASVRLDTETRALSMAQAGGSHVLKAEPGEFPELPQNENLCMNIAEKLEMDVPPHALLSMADGKLCYVIKRFDRLEDGSKIHKETMAQVLSVNTEDKYKGSLEQVGKAIQKYAKNVGLDLISFFERILLSFLTGNGDMHLKNWALLTHPNGEIHLAPCYDFVCSKMYLPAEEDFALSIMDKRNKLRRKDFETLASHLQIDAKAAKNALDKFLAQKPGILALTDGSELSADRKGKFKKILAERYGRLYRP